MRFISGFYFFSRKLNVPGEYDCTTNWPTMYLSSFM